MKSMLTLKNLSVWTSQHKEVPALSDFIQENAIKFIVKI